MYKKVEAYHSNEEKILIKSISEWMLDQETRLGSYAKLENFVIKGKEVSNNIVPLD